MPVALTKGRPSTRPGRWRPTFTATQPRIIDADIGNARHKPESAFLERLARHVAWNLARRFLVKHPLISAQLGLEAVKEATRYSLAETLQRRTRDRDDDH